MKRVFFKSKYLMMVFLLTAGSAVRADESIKPTAEQMKQWENLSAEKKARIRIAWQQYQQMTPEQQEKFKKNSQRFKNLPENRKQELREKAKKFNQLPEHQKRAIKERIKHK